MVLIKEREGIDKKESGSQFKENDRGSEENLK